MKFGMLTVENKIINLGSFIQYLGVLKVYEKMGLKYDDIIKVNFAELSSYKGEKIILPMSDNFMKLYKFEMLPISENITPVFFGFNLTDEKNIKHLMNFKKYFFGCRDLATVDSINKAFDNEVNTFMSGCFSLCLDKREASEKQTKIFMVDVIEELYPYIPKDIIKNAEEITQMYIKSDNDYNSSFNENEIFDSNFDYGIKWYQNLKENAKLVITSRLHTALPCVAMGIPVIVARRYNDDTERYSGYDELFHVYMPDEFKNIDWQPKVKDIEFLKQEIINNAIGLIKATYDNKILEDDFIQNYKKKVEKVDSYFKKSKDVLFYSGENASYLSQQQKEKYYKEKNRYNNIIEYITKKDLSKCNLIIWGGGDKGRYFLRRYENIIDKFKSCVYVDKNEEKQKLKMCDLKGNFDILSPDAIKNYDKDKLVVIVAVKSYYTKIGREIGLELINKYNLTEGKEFFFLDKLDSSARMAIDDIALNATLM